MYKNHKVVVTMTSWPKRIGNCAQVIKTLLNNTLKPDVVYLNLSQEEFPNGERDIPMELVSMFRKQPAFKINWVPGPNTKTMKKVFPILPFLQDDDIVIYIDDDFLLPIGFVKSRVDDFIMHSCKHAVSGWCGHLRNSMLKTLTGIPINMTSQPSSLVTKRMLSGYEVFYNNPDVYARSADDSLYTLLVTLNGYTYVPCSDYGLSQSGRCTHPISNNYRSVSPLKKMGVFKKNGYSQQNTYITHLLYLNIVKNSIVPSWKQGVKNRLSMFKRLPQYEDSEFFSQVDDFKTIDIPIHEGKLRYWYWDGVLNAGDAYNKYLMQKLYACPLEMSKNSIDNLDIGMCGSILTNEHLSKCRRVVGCGIQKRNKTSHLPPGSSYIALRGNITNEFVRSFGKPSREILLCDPGLLLSRLYSPRQKPNKIHKVGIIAHYVDEGKVRQIYGDKYHIISMKTSDIEGLVDDILSCEVILSSSLHGIIFAHAYGVPAYHVQFTDFFKNGNFKFADYYSSFLGKVKYKKFVANDFHIDVDSILKFHMDNATTHNPTQDMVVDKQRRFLQVLPYKQYLKNEFKEEIGISTGAPID